MTCGRLPLMAQSVDFEMSAQRAAFGGRADSFCSLRVLSKLTQSGHGGAKKNPVQFLWPFRLRR